MNGYRKYPIKDLLDVSKIYIKNSEYENNLFLKKYIEETEKIDFESLNDKQAEFLSLYMTLLYNNKFDYENYTIDNIWSFKYEAEKIGFIIKLDVKGEKYIALCDTDSYYGRTHEYITKCNTNILTLSGFEEDKRYGKLNENGGTLKGKYAIIHDKSGITYLPENKEDYINLIQKNKSFFDFINEYTKIYWNHYNETVSNIDFNSKTIPKVGMSKSEVTSTDWGYPNKKNINTYSWGTTEQWVYNKYGYVYFEDDIVTSVSER